MDRNKIHLHPIYFPKCIVALLCKLTIKGSPSLSLRGEVFYGGSNLLEIVEGCTVRQCVVNPKTVWLVISRSNSKQNEVTLEGEFIKIL